MDPGQEITRLLNHAARGEDQDQQLYGLVYEELRAAARAVRARWTGSETLSATALVHEAWLRVGAPEDRRWDSRKHFYVVASRAMRQILMNYAEAARATKRTPPPGMAEAMPLPWTPEETISLHDALLELESRNARQARVVELKFFADLTNDEIAEQLDVSPITVKRDWAFARSWLARQLDREPGA